MTIAVQHTSLSPKNKKKKKEEESQIIVVAVREKDEVEEGIGRGARTEWVWGQELGRGRD